MERDVFAEIDALKDEMGKVQELLAQFAQPQALKERLSAEQRIKTMHRMHPTPEISLTMERLCATANEKNLIGAITYLGVFSSGGRQSNWIKNEIDAGELLELVESRAAEKVLQCVGNNDRLNLLLALLKQPMTVAELVAEHGYSSTGQVYHLLRPLLAADILYEEERGIYAVQPHRVQGIVMLLAGIADILDPKYTQGNWDEIEENEQK